MYAHQIKNNFSAAGEVESGLAAQPLRLFMQHETTGWVALVEVASFRQLVYVRQLDFAQPNSVAAVCSQLEKELSGNSNLAFSFSEVQLCLESAYVLVPATVLQAEGAEKFLPKQDTEEYVVINSGVDDACVLCAADSSLLSFYKNRFAKVNITHTAARFITASAAERNALHVHVHESHLDLLCYNDHAQLQLCQRYPFVTDSDFLYHLLLVCDRCHIDREERPLRLSGLLSRDGSLQTLLAEYFRHIQFATHPGLRFSTALEQLDEHRYFVLYNPAA